MNGNCIVGGRKRHLTPNALVKLTGADNPAAILGKVDKHIHLLVKVEGLTLEGAAKRLKGDRKDVINKSRVLESLRNIRQQLAEIKEDL